MDWSKLIQELLDAKLTQMQIAESCGVAQSTVSDLYRKPDRSPSFELGSKLIALRDATTQDVAPQRLHVEPSVALTAAAEHPAASEDQLLIDAACRLAGGDPRNEYQQYLGYTLKRKGEKPRSSDKPNRSRER